MRPPAGRDVAAAAAALIAAVILAGGCRATSLPAPARAGPSAPPRAAAPPPEGTDTRGDAGRRGGEAGDPPPETPPPTEARDAAEAPVAGSAPPPGALLAAPAPPPAPAGDAVPRDDPRPPARPRPSSLPGSTGRSVRGEEGTLVLTLAASPPAARIGDLVTIEVEAVSHADVLDAPLHLLYDSAALGFFDARAGEFLGAGGAEVVFVANGHTRPGDVVLGAGRADRTRGARGRGTLCTVRFTALAPGPTTVSIGEARAWALGGGTVAVTAGSVEVIVAAPD